MVVEGTAATMMMARIRLPFSRRWQVDHQTRVLEGRAIVLMMRVACLSLRMHSSAGMVMLVLEFPDLASLFPPPITGAALVPLAQAAREGEEGHRDLVREQRDNSQSS